MEDNRNEINEGRFFAKTISDIEVSMRKEIVYPSKIKERLSEEFEKFEDAFDELGKGDDITLKDYIMDLLDKRGPKKKSGKVDTALFYDSCVISSSSWSNFVNGIYTKDTIKKILAGLKCNMEETNRAMELGGYTLTNERADRIVTDLIYKRLARMVEELDNALDRMTASTIIENLDKLTDKKEELLSKNSEIKESQKELNSKKNELRKECKKKSNEFGNRFPERNRSGRLIINISNISKNKLKQLIQHLNEPPVTFPKSSSNNLKNNHEINRTNHLHKEIDRLQTMVKEKEREYDRLKSEYDMMFDEVASKISVLMNHKEQKYHVLYTELTELTICVKESGELSELTDSPSNEDELKKYMSAAKAFCAKGQNITQKYSL